MKGWIFQILFGHTLHGKIFLQLNFMIKIKIFKKLGNVMHGKAM